MPGPLHFVSGLPRSGSTLLLNLLGQNPGHRVTPTSGLIELFVTVKNSWTSFVEFQAEGLEQVRPRVRTALRGLLYGYFEKDIAAGKTVFDKSRGWLQYIEALEESLGQAVKVIVTVRDVRAIVASFERVYRRRGIEYREATGDDFFRCQTATGRAQSLLGDGSVLGLTIARLRDALQRGVADRLVIVPYRSLTQRPEELLGMLHDALGLPRYEYDPGNVQQVTRENDTVYGMDLHTIRPSVEPVISTPWEGILPHSLCNMLAREYADINALATPTTSVHFSHEENGREITTNA